LKGKCGIVMIVRLPSRGGMKSWLSVSKNDWNTNRSKVSYSYVALFGTPAVSIAVLTVVTATSKANIVLIY